MSDDARVTFDQINALARKLSDEANRALEATGPQVATAFRSFAEAMGARSCLVCETPCRSEGQLCPECVAAGHWVTDDTVDVVLDVRF